MTRALDLFSVNSTSDSRLYEVLVEESCLQLEQVLAFKPQVVLAGSACVYQRCGTVLENVLTGHAAGNRIADSTPSTSPLACVRHANYSLGICDRGELNEHAIEPAPLFAGLNHMLKFDAVGCQQSYAAPEYKLAGFPHTRLQSMTACWTPSTWPLLI